MSRVTNWVDNELKLKFCLGHQHSINCNDAHEEQDFMVTLADTGLETMTGGRIKQVERVTRLQAKVKINITLGAGLLAWGAGFSGYAAICLLT